LLSLRLKDVAEAQVESLVKWHEERVGEKGYIDIDVDGGSDRYQVLPLIAGKGGSRVESGESSAITCEL
jgi:hypothetical protein